MEVAKFMALAGIWCYIVYVMYKGCKLACLYLQVRQLSRKMSLITPTIIPAERKTEVWDLTKYYICSGDLNWVGLAESPQFAALHAVSKYPNRSLGPIIYVDNRGYRDKNSRWSFETYEIRTQISEESTYEDEAN